MWFKVDDKLHSHKKSARAGVEAIGLWTLAGAWCADQLSDGFVPNYVAARIDPNHEEHAASLVLAGLWVPGEFEGDTGWFFHEWAEYQPTREQVESRREENRERQRIHRARVSRDDAGRFRSLSQRDAPVTNVSVTDGSPRESPVARPDPTRPDPTRPTKEADASFGSPRSRRRPEGPLPESWRPTAKHAAQAQDLGLDIGTEVMFFRDHAATHDRRARDWDAAFRTWLNKAEAFRRDRGRDSSSPWDRAELVRAPDAPLTCDNETRPKGADNTHRPLTHLSEPAEGG